MITIVSEKLNFVLYFSVMKSLIFMDKVGDECTQFLLILSNTKEQYQAVVDTCRHVSPQNYQYKFSYTIKQIWSY